MRKIPAGQKARACAIMSFLISIEASILNLPMNIMMTMLTISITLSVAQTNFSEKANREEIDELKRRIDELEGEADAA